MLKSLFLTISLLLLTACAQTQNLKAPFKSDISPKIMRADVSVNGRTSQLNHIDIAFLGKTIPSTYSDNKIGNSRHYNWWVSKHFALKSDLPENKVRLYLELLEMSYPHYVELFGMEPLNIEHQRIAVVYGSSRTRIKEAMIDDGFLRGVHKTAGGETMFYNRAGYNFPSHREHHQRYIVIHETMHAFHMALNGHSTWAPNWITEGLADSIASHVYDPDSKTLTFMVFDRAPMNYLSLGLKQYHQAQQPTIIQINDDPTLKRGLNFLIVHFLMNNPTRHLYFKRFIQELMQANPHSEYTLPVAKNLLKTTFPNWKRLEQQFRTFVNNLQPSFTVSGPWEQNGAAYWLRSSNNNTLYQLSIHPNKTPNHPILDFPQPDADPLFIQQSNQIAATIHFEPSQTHIGEIGIGLKPNTTHSAIILPLMITGGRKIQLRLDSIGGQNYSAALEANLVQAIRSAANLNIRVTPNGQGINVILQTPQHQQSFNFKTPFLIDTQAYELLGRNMNHKITPYISTHHFDAHRNAMQTTNHWGYTESNLLLRALNTCEQYLIQLSGCQNKITYLTEQLRDPTKHTLISHSITTLLDNWKSKLMDDAIFELSGVKLRPFFYQNKLYVSLVNPTKHPVSIQLEGSQVKTFTTGTHRIELSTQATRLTYQIAWQNMRSSKELDLASPKFDGVQLTLTQHDNQLTVSLSGPYSGKTTGNISLYFYSFAKPNIDIPIWQSAVSIEPYATKRWIIKEIDLKHYVNGRMEVSAILNVDGEPILLTRTLEQ